MNINDRKRKYDEFVHWIKEDWKYNITGTLFDKSLNRKTKGGFSAYAMKGAKDKGALDAILDDKEELFKHFIAFTLNNGTTGYKKWIVENPLISNIYIDDKNTIHLLLPESSRGSLEQLEYYKKEVSRMLFKFEREELKEFGISNSFISFWDTERLTLASKDIDVSDLFAVETTIITRADFSEEKIWGLPALFKETKYKMAKNYVEKPVFKILKNVASDGKQFIDLNRKVNGSSDRIIVMPVRVSELVEFIEGVRKSHGTVDDIFSLNVRDRSNTNKITKSIVKSIEENPENFFMLNNGITAIVDNIKKSSDDNDIQIELENIKIINGQQTTMSLYNNWIKSGLDEVPTQYVKAFILMKVYKIDEKASDKFTLFNQISNASNQQNAVKSKDLLSTRRFNTILRKELLSLGINYKYRSGVSDYSSQFKGMPTISLNELVKMHYILNTGEVWKRGSIGQVFDSLTGLKDSRANTAQARYANIFNSKSDEDIAAELSAIADLQLYFKNISKELGTEKQALDLLTYISLVLKSNDMEYRLDPAAFAAEIKKYIPEDTDRNNLYKSRKQLLPIVVSLFKTYNLTNSDEYKTITNLLNA